MQGFIEKVNYIIEMYFKRSTQLYIISKEEKAALVNGITREYKLEVLAAFNAGREMERGKYKYKSIKEYMAEKNIR